MQTEYDPKGKYETINGYKTYVYGPEDSDKAIVMLYDIFGYSPQILQGVSVLPCRAVPADVSAAVC